MRFAESYDESLTAEIQRLAAEEGFPAGTMGERDPSLDHGTMVPLYFIRRVFSGARLVRIGLSGLSLEDHYRMGQLIREAVERTGRRAVFVASGDLSHKLQEHGPYGFAPEGPIYDERVTNGTAELTTLIVPGENDSEEEMRELSGWPGSRGRSRPLSTRETADGKSDPPPRIVPGRGTLFP